MKKTIDLKRGDYITTELPFTCYKNGARPVSVMVEQVCESFVSFRLRFIGFTTSQSCEYCESILISEIPSGVK